MSEMDDVEFIETIVANQKEFVSKQLAAFKEESQKRSNKLEERIRALEQELKKKDEEMEKMKAEIPNHVHQILRNILKEGVRALEHKEREPDSGAEEIVEPECSAEPAPKKTKVVE
jgi:seryl-tRNA synthetase